MKLWRLLHTGAFPGAVNMAIDQALLAMHANGKSGPILRFYQWHPPAISLGYCQRRHEINVPACERLGIDVVRRPTGGKAVLHQDDLTYAIVAGVSDGIPEAAMPAYRFLCEGLLRGFRYLGFEAALGRETMKFPQGDICFLRAAIGDIVHGGRKFVGSAQTWHASSVLQHGSIMLKPQINTLVDLWEKGTDSAEALRRMLKSRLTSLQEILRYPQTVPEISTAIQKGLEHTMGITCEPDELTPDEWQLTQEFILKEQDLCPMTKLPRSPSAVEKSGSLV